MKPFAPLLIALLGFGAGWCLPTGSSGPATPPPPAFTDSHRSEQKQRALLESLLEPHEFDERQRSSLPLVGLLAKVKEGYVGDEDIARIVALDPVAAMDDLLNDPSAGLSIARRVAEAWADREPEKALRYLRDKQSFRAGSSLAGALCAAYPHNPKLVGEVLRSRSRDWQRYHLRALFSSTYPAPGSDGSAATRHFGTELLDCLADDALRESAKDCWKEEEEEEEPVAAQPSPPDSNDKIKARWQRDEDLLADLREHREETIGFIASNGSHQIRQIAMQHLLSDFPRDPKTWERALARLETEIGQLGVVPDQPPSDKEFGPFLQGPVAAAWLDRQPLALRRHWAVTFVETWTWTDPQAAVNWAQALPAEARRDEALQNGLIFWTHRDPTAAIAYVDGLPAGDLREVALSNAAATWNCIDPTAARKWVEGLPDSPGKQRALERLKH